MEHNFPVSWLGWYDFSQALTFSFVIRRIFHGRYERIVTNVFFCWVHYVCVVFIMQPASDGKHNALKMTYQNGHEIQMIV